MKRRVILTATATSVLALGACGAETAQAGATLEDASPDASPTMTMESTCDDLVGHAGLVAQAMAGAQASKAARTWVQGRLFEIVASGPATLQDPVGQLVDYLDDPVVHQPLDGGPDDEVTRAADVVLSVCS